MGMVACGLRRVGCGVVGRFGGVFIVWLTSFWFSP